MFLLAAVLATGCGAHPAFVLQPVTRNVSGQRAGGVYRASASLVFRVVRRPGPVLASHDPGLIAHARGHAVIAQRVADSSIGTVQAVGSTRAQAQAHLKQALSRLAGDAQKELDREERVYDSITDDGYSQSQGPVYGFAGGPNARDRCARR